MAVATAASRRPSSSRNGGRTSRPARKAAPAPPSGPVTTSRSPGRAPPRPGTRSDRPSAVTLSSTRSARVVSPPRTGTPASFSPSYSSSTSSTAASPGSPSVTIRRERLRPGSGEVADVHRRRAEAELPPREQVEAEVDALDERVLRDDAVPRPPRRRARSRRARPRRSSSASSPNSPSSSSVTAARSGRARRACPGRARRARRTGARETCPGRPHRPPRPRRRRRTLPAPRPRPRAARPASPRGSSPSTWTTMQPVPVTAASSSCPFATASTRSPSETWSTGPGNRRDDAELRAGHERELRRRGLRPHRLDAAHLGARPDERRHLAGVPAQHRHLDPVEDPLRRRGPIARSRRRRRDRGRPEASAPSPPRPRAASTRPRPARACRCSARAPTRARSSPRPPRAACAITGSAPIARVALAVSFITT